VRPETCRSLCVLKHYCNYKKCVHFFGLYCNRRQKHGSIPITIGVEGNVSVYYRRHKRGSVTVTHNVQDVELLAEDILGHITLISGVDQRRFVFLSTGMRDCFLEYASSNFCGRYVVNCKLIILFYVTLHDARELGRQQQDLAGISVTLRRWG